MEIIRTIDDMSAASAKAKRAGLRVALVPTMGALHEGHASLMRVACASGAIVVVSIYVNPTQFGPAEDFGKYPRAFDADSRLCEREGVAIVFAPTDDEMYPDGPAAVTAWVDETAVAQRFEAERRPGHFRGVCTVVAKLFNIVKPDLACFGQKDFQQLKVVERMVRDLCYPIKVVPVPTVREADGLALSSRNRYLSPAERAQATVLWTALNLARDLFAQGERDAQRLQAAMTRAVELAPAARLDYAAIADAATLAPLRDVQGGAVALLAAFVGHTRLIDNLVL